MHVVVTYRFLDLCIVTCSVDLSIPGGLEHSVGHESHPIV